MVFPIAPTRRLHPVPPRGICRRFDGRLALNYFVIEGGELAVVQGLKIFYREAGKPGNPKLVLLHGFPSSLQPANGAATLAGDWRAMG